MNIRTVVRLYLQGDLGIMNIRSSSTAVFTGGSGHYEYP
jgi:hypothetical protein